MWIERLMAGISHQHVLSYNPIFTLRETMNWNNNKKGALNLFDSSAKGMHNVDQKQELA